MQVKPSQKPAPCRQPATQASANESCAIRDSAISVQVIREFNCAAIPMEQLIEVLKKLLSSQPEDQR
jgi:hypothetical protein